MGNPRLVLCGGVQVKDDKTHGESKSVLRLNTTGSSPNVHVRLEDVARAFQKHASERMIDLLELAAYVFATDTARARSKGWAKDGSEELWRRKHRIIVPVHDYRFWHRKEVLSILREILAFLSDDQFGIDFRKRERRTGIQEFLEFAEIEEWPFRGVSRVIMFSGGLDSLAGAVETAARGENLVLVSHRPVATTDKRQRDLYEQLRKQFDVRMIRVPVFVNKGESLGRDATQRTRSFLYSALGAVVASSVQADGIRFFENGVVSLNLPVADEVIGARASRTTHPWVLKLFGELYSLVLERQMVVDNPYLHLTKAEVVARIGAADAGALIRYTCSCTHTMFKSKNQWHCGKCSQCIDRRVAILAAGLERYEDEHDYECDVFAGPRKAGYEQSMAVNYARHGLELARMNEGTFAERFNAEIIRAVRPEVHRREAADALVALHKRHGTAVAGVLQKQVTLHSGSLLRGELESTSMLAMIAGQKHLESAWRQYVCRIHSMLEEGVPAMCVSARPANEPQLQAWCDGILKGRDVELVREYPFMRWASAQTKPDWSSERLALWIELKYARKGTPRSRITDEIAADVTKYGSNNRHVLFVIYDPDRVFTDDDEVIQSVGQHRDMMVRFLR